MPPIVVDARGWNAPRAGVRCDVGFRPRQRAEQTAAVVRLAVAVLRARIVLDFDRAQAALAADVDHARFGIGRRAAVDVHAAGRAGRVPGAAVLRRTVRALAVGRRGRDEVRAHAALLRELQCGIFDRRRVVDEIRRHEALLRVRRRPRRNRLRRRRLLARHFALQHRRLRHRPDRLAGHAIEDVDPALLRRRGDDLARLAVDRDVEKVRRHRRVVVPDVVVHELEVPLPHAGLHVDRDDAVREQVVARTMAAVFVAEAFADGDVDETEFRIGAVRRPRIVLADADRPDLRAVLPRFGAELTRLRNEIELPELLAGVHVEAADEARDVVQSQRVVAVNRRVADDDHVADDDCR